MHFTIIIYDYAHVSFALPGVKVADGIPLHSELTMLQCTAID